MSARWVNACGKLPRCCAWGPSSSPYSPRPDVDFNGRFIEVRRNLVAGRVTTPKDGKTRRADMSAQLTDVLRALQRTRKKETLKNGSGSVPDWIFCTESGGPLDGDNPRHRVFYKLLEKGQLPRVGGPRTPHTLPRPPPSKRRAPASA